MKINLDIRSTQVGEKLKSETQAVVKEGRLWAFASTSADHLQAIIECTVEELAEVVKRAKSFKRTKCFKKHGYPYFKHLSPDVSFCIVEKVKKKKCKKKRK